MNSPRNICSSTFSLLAFVLLFIAFSPALLFSQNASSNETHTRNVPARTQTAQRPSQSQQSEHRVNQNTGTTVRHVDPNNSQPVRHVDQNNSRPVHHEEQNFGQPVHRVDQGSGQTVHRADQNNSQPVHRVDQDNSRTVHHVDQGSSQPVHRVDQGSGQTLHRADQNNSQPVHRVDQGSGQSMHHVDQGSGQTVHRADQGNNNQTPHHVDQDHRFSGAQTVTRPDGGAKYTHADGRNWEVNKSGQLTHYYKPGVDARFRDNGKLSNARFVRPDHSQLTIHRTSYGARHFEVVRPDHSRVVAFGPRYGYVQRPLIARPGYISRTYVWGGRPYVHVYRSYMYQRIVYYRYVPAYYYHPVFYGWVFNPWRSPVVFSWGWGPAPWYGYYGGYFEPAPVYPTASLWLTDYLLAENLRLAYENRREAEALAQAQNRDQYAQVSLTPAVKQQIADEVRMQIEEDRAAAAQTSPAVYSQDAPPPVLDPKHRVFVVSMDLDVLADGQQCSLTPGDIILRSGDMVDGTRIPVSVLTSKPGDCAVNSTTSILVADLQEMHNRFREQIDSGLQTLAEKQGKNGLPTGPAARPREVAEGLAEPDPNVENQLTQQQEEANRAESEIEQAAQPN